eukprot:m.161439 g.161439  ORF g.161439 m.161439 type:complete len:378 (+) comp12075_c0_seq1:354-1487(+)
MSRESPLPPAGPHVGHERASSGSTPEGAKSTARQDFAARSDTDVAAAPGAGADMKQAEEGPAPAGRKAHRAARAAASTQEDDKEVYSTRNLYVSGLSRTAQSDDLLRMFSPYGNIISAKAVTVKERPWECQGYGFVMFEDAADAAVAVEKVSSMPGILVQFAKASARKTTPSRKEDPTNLYFSNLPLSYDEWRLKAMLEPYGHVVSCRILRDFHTNSSRGVGFARMQSREMCEAVLDAFNGFQLEDISEPLICKFADSPKGHKGSAKQGRGGPGPIAWPVQPTDPGRHGHADAVVPYWAPAPGEYSPVPVGSPGMYVPVVMSAYGTPMMASHNVHYGAPPYAMISTSHDVPTSMGHIHQSGAHGSSHRFLPTTDAAA